MRSNMRNKFEAYLEGNFLCEWFLIHNWWSKSSLPDGGHVGLVVPDQGAKDEQLNFYTMTFLWRETRNHC